MGDDLDTLTEIVNESRRLKPEWHDMPQSVLISIVQDFFDQADPFDQFILTRADSEQRELLRKITELKGLKRAVREGTLDEGPDTNRTEESPKEPHPSARTSPAAPPPLGSRSPAVL